MRPHLLGLLLVVVCCVAGCDRDSRLHGQWTFDREYTEAQLPPKVAGQESKTESLEAMKQQLAAMLIPALIDKLDGCTLTITPKEMIFVTKDGTGKAEGYEIVERPTNDTWRVKTAEGKVETYSRQGERLSSPAMGDVQLTTYFKATK